jgi:dienelactone hydrolase
MLKWLVNGAVYLMAGGSLAVFAQSVPEYSMRGAERATDLKFPTEATHGPVVSEPGIALYKPEGMGPFPALVLLHQCGGLVFRGDRPNASMFEWSREGLDRGYVVLVLDSFGQRGVDTVCLGPKGDIFPSRGVRDALQAAAHLRALPYVDKRRVAFAGYSWGGGVGLLLSSSEAARAVRISDRFDAAASFYPPCRSYPKVGDPYSWVLAGIDRPLLVLLGGKDNETPPEECVGDLSPHQAKGVPIEWHLYAQATHCWDCKQLHGFKKVDIRGSNIEYRYDEAVTRDSVLRVFSFFDKAFGQASCGVPSIGNVLPDKSKITTCSNKEPLKH